MNETLTTDSLAEFEALATRFARTLRAGDAVALEGDLGAGKTTFVRAIVRALHDRDSASSPTFTFRQRYDGAPPIEHLDLYRIEDPAEAIELGLDDAFGPATLTLVEWPERLPSLLPRGAIRIAIAGCGAEPRHIRIVRDDGADSP